MKGVRQEKTLPRLGNYIGFLFSPFFKYWWAALTGCASVLAMYVTPSYGITLSGSAMMTATFITLLLIFMTISALVKSWELYFEQHYDLQVSSFERNRNMPGGWVFVLVGDIDLAVGTVIDIHKKTGEVEVPLSLVQIASRNSSGAYQATPLGKINPIHINEHSKGALRPADLIVRTSVDLRRIQEVANDLR